MIKKLKKNDGKIPAYRCINDLLLYKIRHKDLFLSARMTIIEILGFTGNVILQSIYNPNTLSR